MAKTIVNEDFLKRLKAASANGSVIATDIVAELAKPIEDITDRTANYFDCIRIMGTANSSSDQNDETGIDERSYRTISIEVSYCSKDLTNENFPDKDNPQAPYYSRNRTRVSPSTFIGLFKNLRGNYTNAEIQYFDSAIRVPFEVTLKIVDSMQDIIHAYDFRKYYNIAQDKQSPLHKSCMRHTYQADICGDFYHNFTGSKVCVAESPDGEVLARMILWDNVTYKYIDAGSESHIDLVSNLQERLYASFDFLNTLVRNYACSQGYKIKKYANDYHSKRDFCIMEECDIAGVHFDASMYFCSDAEVKVPATKWHKNGAAYLDTFSYLYYDEYAQQLILTNDSDVSPLVELTSADGTSYRRNYLCPICGNTHSDTYGNTYLCYDCYNRLYKRDKYGIRIMGKTKQYNGESYPEDFIDGKGVTAHPNPHFQACLDVEKLLS